MPNAPIRLLLALVTAAAPSAAAANGPAADSKATPLAVDVCLHEGGTLLGQLVSESGEPRTATEVKLSLPDGRHAVAVTDANGAFAFRGVQGVATLQSGPARAIVRGWSEAVAPPNATRALLLVEQNELARGQHYAGTGTQSFVNRSKRLFANPLFVAGVVATAVAIPVAIANDDDDPAS